MKQKTTRRNFINDAVANRMRSKKYREGNILGLFRSGLPLYYINPLQIPLNRL